MAVLNAFAGVDLLVQQCSKRTTPNLVHAKMAFHGRLITSVCGLLLLLVCMDYKMRLALRDMGTHATAPTQE